jgi:hypothetical protein
MPYQIRTVRGRLEIDIDAPRDAREAFCELLDACTQGDRACPALRCGAVETTVPAGDEDAPIRITLTPHPGITVDPGLIERCLKFTLGCGARRCCDSARS